MDFPSVDDVIADHAFRGQTDIDFQPVFRCPSPVLFRVDPVLAEKQKFYPEGELARPGNFSNFLIHPVRFAQSPSFPYNLTS